MLNVKNPIKIVDCPKWQFDWFSVMQSRDSERDYTRKCNKNLWQQCNICASQAESNTYTEMKQKLFLHDTNNCILKWERTVIIEINVNYKSSQIFA